MPETFSTLPIRPLLHPHAEQSNLINVRYIFLAIRERWVPTILLTALLCAGLAYGLLTRPALYAANTTLLIERSNDRVLDIKQVVDDTVESSLTDALLLTHIQQIHSHSFLSTVVASLTPAQRKNFFAKYQVEGEPRTIKDTLVAENERLEDFVGRNLKVERAGRTLLIGLIFQHRDPQVAAMMVNQIADQYIMYLINRSTASNDSALTFLNAQADELRQKVEKAEQAAQTYREKYNLVFLEHDQTILNDRLRAISSASSQARVTRLALDARVGQAEAVLNGSEDDARQLASQREFVAFADIQRQLDELRSRRASMAERYGRLHPLMQENASSIAALEKLRGQQLTAALGDLRNQRTKALTEEKQLEGDLAAAEKESLRLDQLAVEYNTLKREVDTARETYALILSRLNETAVSSRLHNTNVKSVDRATPPDKPISPNPTKIAIEVSVLGLVTLICFPLTIEILDKRVRSYQDVEEYLGVPLLAEITKANHVKRADRAMTVARNLDESAVESFRGLHYQVQTALKSSYNKTLLVTSTIPEEGKSYVACNLGASLAAHGKRTLLIDADFRQPALHRSFKLPNDAGALMWLESDARVDGNLLDNKLLGIVQVSPRLYLLRSGGVSRRLTEFMETETLTHLVEALRSKFDMMIIDTPPAGVFSDAEALAPLASGIVYVSRFKGAQKSHIRQVLQHIGKMNFRVIGVVLNAMPAGRFTAHYYSSFGYNSNRYREYYAKEHRRA